MSLEEKGQNKITVRIGDWESGGEKEVEKEGSL